MSAGLNVELTVQELDDIIRGLTESNYMGHRVLLTCSDILTEEQRIKIQHSFARRDELIARLSSDRHALEMQIAMEEGKLGTNGT